MSQLTQPNDNSLDIGLRLISGDIHDVLNRGRVSPLEPIGLNHLIDVLLLFCHKRIDRANQIIAIPRTAYIKSRLLIGAVPNARLRYQH